MPRAKARPRARAGAASLPLQRTPRTAILVLVAVTEPVAAVVRRGSEAAREAHLPLEIVVLAPDGTTSAACMSTMDEALHLARSVAPELAIRAESSGLGGHPAHAGRSSSHPLVVASPRTWDTFAHRGDLRWLHAGKVEVV